MMFRIIIFGLALTISNSALAVSLQNKDSKKYNIRVKSNSGTMTGSINGGTIKNDICKSSCKIEVQNVGSVNASGSDRVVIKDGKINK